MNRRSFLTGIIAACAAPAIVRSGLLMPVKPQFEPFVTHLVPYADLHLSMEDFVRRILEPAMEVMARNIEMDAFTSCAPFRFAEVGQTLKIRRPHTDQIAIFTP